MALKIIKSNSYIKNVQAEVILNPNRAKKMQDPAQNDPKIRTFNVGYTNLALSGFSIISHSDATLLDDIQKDIRFHLRRLGAQNLSN